MSIIDMMNDGSKIKGTKQEFKRWEKLLTNYGIGFKVKTNTHKTYNYNTISILIDKKYINFTQG